MIFGKKIKELREERGLLQRQLSAALEIDTPMYSKIERGERKAKRSQIPIMAKLFDVEEKELLTIWLADKVLDTVEDASEVKNDAIAYVQNEIAPHVLDHVTQQTIQNYLLGGATLGAMYKYGKDYTPFALAWLGSKNIAQPIVNGINRFANSSAGKTLNNAVDKVIDWIF